MKINVVVVDWLNAGGESVYPTDVGLMLTAGDFHAGSTFKATINTEGNDTELRDALKKGFRLILSVRMPER